MATGTTGGVKIETLTDGTLVFRLRFRAYGRRRSVPPRAARLRMRLRRRLERAHRRTELGNILARSAPASGADTRTRPGAEGPTSPTFHEYASPGCRQDRRRDRREADRCPRAVGLPLEAAVTCSRSSRATAWTKSIASSASPSRAQARGAAAPRRDRRRRGHPRPARPPRVPARRRRRSAR